MLGQGFYRFPVLLGLGVQSGFYLLFNDSGVRCFVIGNHILDRRLQPSVGVLEPGHHSLVVILLGLKLGFQGGHLLLKLLNACSTLLTMNLFEVYLLSGGGNGRFLDIAHTILLHAEIIFFEELLEHDDLAIKACSLLLVVLLPVLVLTLHQIELLSERIHLQLHEPATGVALREAFPAGAGTRTRSARSIAELPLFAEPGLLIHQKFGNL